MIKIRWPGYYLFVYAERYQLHSVTLFCNFFSYQLIKADSFLLDEPLYDHKTINQTYFLQQLKLIKLTNNYFFTNVALAIDVMNANLISNSAGWLNYQQLQHLEVTNIKILQTSFAAASLKLNIIDVPMIALCRLAFNALNVCSAACFAVLCEFNEIYYWVEIKNLCIVSINAVTINSNYLVNSINEYISQSSHIVEKVFSTIKFKNESNPCIVPLVAVDDYLALQRIHLTERYLVTLAMSQNHVFNISN